MMKGSTSFEPWISTRELMNCNQMVYEHDSSVLHEIGTGIFIKIMHKKEGIWEEALQNKHVFKNTIRN